MTHPRPVAILTHATSSFVTALIGSLEAGAAALPLNPQDPDERLAFMLGDAGCDVLVTDGPLAARALALARACESVEHVVVVDEDVDGRDGDVTVHGRSVLETQPAHTGSARVPADAPAYVVYTSGTTGAPKGVAITHENVVPLLLWQREHFGLGPSVVAVQTLSPTFDFGLQEIFTSVFFGGTLVAPPAETLRHPPSYAAFVAQRRATMIYLTPSYCDEVVAAGRAMPDLRTVLVGGEVLSKQTAADLVELTSDDCVVYNGYGPTEASINCLMYPIDRARLSALPSRSVPVGRVTGNSRVYVLGAQLELVPPGVPGEIFIGGVGVAAGYLDRPEMTAERFVPDPFGEAGARLYRTGDMARVLPSGDVEILGRRDDQVKIRGFRVEVREVEAVLRDRGDVRDCVVCARDDVPGGRQLIAYVVPRDASVSAGDLRRAAARRLPSYMVPSRFVLLDSLPMNQNGKVDRRRLPAPAAAAPRPGGGRPRQLEAAVTAVFRETLGLDDVPVDVSFFELGGHSLLATRAHRSLEQTLGRDVPITALFAHPTIRSLTSFLGDGDGEVRTRTPRRRRARRRRAPAAAPADEVNEA